MRSVIEVSRFFFANMPKVVLVVNHVVTITLWTYRIVVTMWDNLVSETHGIGQEEEYRYDGFFQNHYCTKLVILGWYVENQWVRQG